jgi:predicted nucleotidyltransferase
MGTSDILAPHREQIQRIAARHGAMSLRVFGSVARGDARPDSDVDLLVEMERGRTLLDVVAIKQDVEDLLDRKVDVVTQAAISPYMRESVLKEAVSL